MWCVVLQPKGTTRNVVIPASCETHSPAAVGTILRRATPPVLIGTYSWNGHVLHLYGYKTGKAGTENKHELPPPHDTVLLFGDAVVIATKEGALTSFSTTEYTKCYNELLGGFDDVGSEDSDDEDGEEDGEDEEEEEEEEEDDDDDTDDDDDKESVPDIEEDDDEPPPPPVKIPKVKRTTKKMPAWYSLPELTPEPYTLVAAPHTVA